VRYVDHDPGAARAAAARCRDAAHRYDQIAGWLHVTPATVAWRGGERDEVVHRAGRLGGDLRREAAALRATAARLEAAARAAEHREHELATEAAREAAAAAVCPVLPGGPTVAPAAPRRESQQAPTGGSVLPAGVR
jgi:hypothetical protein